jgi:hypothetical protein
MITIFCDFYQFLVNKLAFFSKTNVTIKFVQIVAAKNANIFAQFLGENIFKIITSVPGKVFLIEYHHFSDSDSSNSCTLFALSLFIDKTMPDEER